MVTIHQYNQYITVTLKDVHGSLGVRKLLDSLTSTSLAPVPYPDRKWVGTGSNRTLDIEYYSKNPEYMLIKFMKNGTKSYQPLQHVPSHHFYHEFQGMLHLPISMLESLTMALTNEYTKFTVVKEQPIHANKINIRYKSDIVLRPYQIEYKKAILDNNRVLVELKTGYGKTVTALNALCELRHRFAVFILGRYIDKWISDITSITNIKHDQICVISGSSKLIKLLAHPEKFKKFKCFIFSTSTLNSFINNKAEEVAHPSLIFKQAKIQTVLIDEAHQSFNMVNKALLFANVERVIALTATLITKDKSMSHIYRLVFDSSTRPRIAVKDDKYIHIYPIKYKLPKYITHNSNKFTLGGMYNHAKLEETISRNPVRLKLYFDLVYLALNGTYLKTSHVLNNDRNMKALVFFSTVHICEDFVRYLATKSLPAWMVVHKYTQEDSYSTIEETNIIVSTIGSSGVGLDIPHLCSIVQTININSEASNRQSFGRLRNLKGYKMRFAFLYCSDIQQHVRYRQGRLETWKPFTAGVYSKMKQPFNLVLGREDEVYENEFETND